MYSEGLGLVGMRKGRMHLPYSVEIHLSLIRIDNYHACGLCKKHLTQT